MATKKATKGKSRITAKQRAARKKNMAIARSAKKKGRKKGKKLISKKGLHILAAKISAANVFFPGK